MLNIVLLGITSLLTDISSEMVYPILPIYLVSQLGAGPQILGLIEGIAESLASLLKVFSGYFSDRIKTRKPFAIFGYASSAAGKLILYISSTWLYVLFARLVDRFGKGVRTAPRDAIIADSAQEKKRGAAFGLHRAMDTFGAAIGVALAYFLITRYQGNFKKIFLFSLIPAVIGVLFLFFVREKRVPLRSSHEELQFSRPLIKSGAGSRIAGKWRALDRKLKLFLIFTFIFTLGNSSNQFLLLRANNLGFAAVTVILLYLVYNVSYALFSYPAGKISDILGRKSLIVTGYFIYGIVYLGFAVTKQTGALWILFVVYGIYMGLTEGVEKAFIADNSPQESKATFLGMHATLVGIGLLPASIIAGMLWNVIGPSAPFYFGSITGILSGFAFLIFI